MDLFGFIIRIYHNAQSSEYQICNTSIFISVLCQYLKILCCCYLCLYDPFAASNIKITSLYKNVLIGVGPDVLNEVKVWVIRTYMLAQNVLPLQKFNFFSRLHIFEDVFLLG